MTKEEHKARIRRRLERPGEYLDALLLDEVAQIWAAIDRIRTGLPTHSGDDCEDALEKALGYSP